MATKINRDNIYIHLLEKQFNLIDKTIPDALLEKKWQDRWNISEKKYNEFKKYSIPLIKKVFKCNTNKSKAVFDWFILMHGMKIK